MRNHWLDILKLGFILFVAFWHTGWTGMTHGYLPVEFFFIVSGFFVFRAYEVKKLSVREFFINRCKRLLPTYWSILFLYVTFSIFAPQFYISADILSKWIGVLVDSVLLQATGLFSWCPVHVFRYNYPDWYLSSFFWSGLFLYTILQIKKYRIVILSFLVLGVYLVYFLFLQNTFNELWGYYGFMYMPLWRGLAGMSVGALIGIVNCRCCIQDCLKRYPLVYNLIALCSLTLILFSFYLPLNMDVFVVFLFAIIVENAFSEFGLNYYFSKVAWSCKVPDISLEILLLHQFMIIITAKICTLIGILYVDSIKFLLFIVILISSAWSFKLIVEPIVSRILFSLYNKIASLFKWNIQQ